MPYVKQERRDTMVDNRRVPAHLSPQTVGELNYYITTTCIAWVQANGISYKTVNDVIGALECAKLEFYRRLAVPYEDKKIEQNGDVYPNIY